MIAERPFILQDLDPCKDLAAASCSGRVVQTHYCFCFWEIANNVKLRGNLLTVHLHTSCETFIGVVPRHVRLQDSIDKVYDCTSTLNNH